MTSPPDTETDLEPPTPPRAPKILGIEMDLIDECAESHILHHWWLPLSILEIHVREHRSGYWSWGIDQSSTEWPTFEECLDDLARELRFLRRELGNDWHTQTGIDAYALHLGKQAANGLILEHETKWLEQYDQRRTNERKPT